MRSTGTQQTEEWNSGGATTELTDAKSDFTPMPRLMRYFNVLNYLSIFKVISISHFLFRTIIKLRSLFFQIVKQVNMHNHEIDSRDVEIKKLKQILKRQALETDDDPRIVSNSVFLTSFWNRFEIKIFLIKYKFLF